MTGAMAADADADTEFAAMVRERIADAFGFWWHGGLHYRADDAPRQVTGSVNPQESTVRKPGTESLCGDGPPKRGVHKPSNVRHRSGGAARRMFRVSKCILKPRRGDHRLRHVCETL